MAKLHFRPYIPNQTVLFPQRIDENIAANDPVRIVNAVVDNLNLDNFKKLYKETGRSAYHPKMMLKVIIYAYMNNIYSCRKIEKLLLRDIHYIWLAGNEHPDFITINRFRNRVKEEINNVFTQLVLVLADKGFISLDVEYIDGTKIESKANKYTFVWRKTVERNRTRLMDKIRILLEQVDETIAQENSVKDTSVEFTPSMLSGIANELKEALEHRPATKDKEEKKTLREKIYEKLLRLGASYNEQVKTSEVVQVAVEGVDQLETYFGAYLPQFFYAMLAPLTLFMVLCFINIPAAIVLLVCVPLIPIAIAAVQTWAKKLLSKYWGQYTALGDTFLENLQGLTTLKIYQADEFKNKEMNVEAEKFRKITMKVLTMQLNSITVMDLIAYGGAALGVIMAVTQYVNNHVSLAGCLLIILLAADFFLPMRQLGSFFHIALV